MSKSLFDPGPRYNSNITRVVNIRKEECDVYIGRGPGGTHMLSPAIMIGSRGWLGNPWSDGTREENIEKFEETFLERVKDPEFREAVLALHLKKLGCWCAPKPCHGNIIARWIDHTIGSGLD